MNRQNIKDFEEFGMYFFNYDTRRISGFCSRNFFNFKNSLAIGQLLRCKMQSGKSAIFRLTDLKYMDDPKDQYFGTVEDVGYEDEF